MYNYQTKKKTEIEDKRENPSTNWEQQHLQSIWSTEVSSNGSTDFMKQANSHKKEEPLISQKEWSSLILPGCDMQTPIAQQHLHEGEANQGPLYEQTNDLLTRDGFLHPSKQESNVSSLNLPAKGK